MLKEEAARTCAAPKTTAADGNAVTLRATTPVIVTVAADHDNTKFSVPDAAAATTTD